MESQGNALTTQGEHSRQNISASEWPLCDVWEMSIRGMDNRTGDPVLRGDLRLNGVEESWSQGGVMCADLINLERADVALFIIDACTALNALPV